MVMSAPRWGWVLCGRKRIELPLWSRDKAILFFVFFSGEVLNELQESSCFHAKNFGERLFKTLPEFSFFVKVIMMPFQTQSSRFPL